MNKKLRIILGALCAVLAVTISISVFQIINLTGNKSIKKEVNKLTKFEYADDDFVEFLDDVIDSVTDSYDDAYDYLDDSDEPSVDDTDDSDTPVEDSSEPEEDEEIVDDMDWLEDEEKTENKTYTSAIQKVGTTPVDDAVRNVTVDASKVAYKNFYGLGGCIFPEVLSNDAIASGFSSVAWEYERQKLINSKIRFARIPMDIDAIVTDIEEDDQRLDYQNNKDYKNYMQMIYDFGNDSVNGLWENLDALKAAGTSAIFNPGWKCNERIKVWYPDVPSDWANSAPYDINAFVRASVCWILEAQEKDLIDAIDFVAFGNEVTWGGDFKTNTDLVKYHTILVTTMAEALEYARNNKITYYSYENGSNVKREVKLNKDLKLIALDTVPGSTKLIERQQAVVESLNKALGNKAPYASSIHKYYTDGDEGTIYATGNYSTAYDVLSELRETVGRQMVTEFYASPAGVDTAFQNSDRYVAGKWETSYTSYFIAAANTGAGGLANWSYASSYYPCVYQLNSYKLADGSGQLFSAQNGKDTYRLTANYRLAALLQHTVPQYSNVLTTKWEGEDLRVTAFKLKDGGYTFVVEAKKSESERTLKLKLNEAFGKKLYKYNFIDNKNENHNALQGALLQPVSDFNVETTAKSFSDTLNKDYGVYVYSTVAPSKEVVLDKALEEVSKGESLTINASLVNCTGDIEWKVTAASKSSGTSLEDKNLLGEGDGKISNSNITVTQGNNKQCTLNIPSTLKSGDSVAVRATLKGEPNTYAVVVVYVK